MRDAQFWTWLEKSTHLPKRQISDALSRCKRIEKIPGINLDDEYRRDGGRSILDLLSYSADDKRHSKPAPDGIDFAQGADIKNGLSCLRTAATRYFDFCKLEK